MPGQAIYESPIHSDPTKDVTYKGFKYGQILHFGTFNCPAVAEGYANEEGCIVPASQTGTKIYVPLDGLKVGDKVISFRVFGYITSGGNAVTVDADIIEVPKAGTPADPTGDGSNDITQVSKTAAYDMDEECVVTADTCIIEADKTYHILLLSTTGAGCTIQYTGIEVTIDRK